MRRDLSSAVILVLFVLFLPYIFRMLGIILLVAVGYMILSRIGSIGQRRSNRYQDNDDARSARGYSSGRSSGLPSDDDDDLIRSDMNAEVVILPESALRKERESR